jgi:hypothetical protein
MIKVKVIKESSFKKVIIEGHALYDDFGKDIVCAAASSIVTTTVNACIKLKEDALTYKYMDDSFEIDNISIDDTTQKLIGNMVSLLEELQENYPKNIIVK